MHVSALSKQVLHRNHMHQRKPHAYLLVHLQVWQLVLVLQRQKVLWHSCVGILQSYWTMLPLLLMLLLLPLDREPLARVGPQVGSHHRQA